jgi:hypothetical protein
MDADALQDVPALPKVFVLPACRPVANNAGGSAIVMGSLGESIINLWTAREGAQLDIGNNKIYITHLDFMADG